MLIFVQCSDRREEQARTRGSRDELHQWGGSGGRGGGGTHHRTTGYQSGLAGSPHITGSRLGTGHPGCLQSGGSRPTSEK